MSIKNSLVNFVTNSYNNFSQMDPARKANVIVNVTLIAFLAGIITNPIVSALIVTGSIAYQTAENNPIAGFVDSAKRSLAHLLDQVDAVVSH